MYYITFCFILDKEKITVMLDIRPNHTIYVNNLNEKVKKEGKWLFFLPLFSDFLFMIDCSISWLICFCPIILFFFFLGSCVKLLIDVTFSLFQNSKDRSMQYSHSLGKF